LLGAGPVPWLDAGKVGRLPKNAVKVFKHDVSAQNFVTQVATW
jgi:hypothetical protein